jgi:ribosomal protein S18 acetylase RimI-like enzyme
VTGSHTVRRELRPGDLGRIVAHHGAVYLPEYGLDSTFEAHVGASVAAAGKRGFPREREGIWIVEVDGNHAGSVALTDEGDGLAALRWVVLDPALRGQGLGHRLIGEVLDEAEAFGYEVIGLETFSELRAAGHLYRSQGFELRWEETAPRWGRERITYQRYELNFQVRAQSSRPPSTGSSERPFSVSA